MTLSLKNGITFGVLSTIAGFLMGRLSPSSDWAPHMWIPIAVGSFTVAYTLPRLLIEKSGNYSNKRLWLTSIAIGFLSHWLSWYVTYLVYYLYILFTDWNHLDDAINPLVAIYASGQMSLISILVFGWIAFPLSIGTLFYLSDSKTK